MWGNEGGCAEPYSDGDVRAVLSHVASEVLPPGAVKAAAKNVNTILEIFESAVRDRDEANGKLKPTDFWMDVNDKMLDSGELNFVMESRTRILNGSIAATVDAFRDNRHDQPAAFLIVRHVSSAVFGRLLDNNGDEEAKQQKKNGSALSMAAVVHDAKCAWIAYLENTPGKTKSGQPIVFLKIALDLDKAKDNLHALMFGRATVLAAARAHLKAGTASTLMRRALLPVITMDATEIEPQRRPNQYTQNLPGNCKCMLAYVAASTTVMVVSSPGKESQTYTWHSEFPTKTNAAVFFAVDDKGLALRLRTAFQHAGNAAFKWVYNHVEYTSTYSFLPPSAKVTDVIENHTGHGPLCKSKDAADLDKIDWVDLLKLKLGGMTIMALQQRINTTLGISLAKQTIINRIKLARKKFDGETWNKSARKQMIQLGYMDESLKEQNAYTQLIVESAANKDKCLIALTTCPSGKRGHADREVVLVSPLGSDMLYSITESEFDTLIDPGSDGVGYIYTPMRRASF